MLLTCVCVLQNISAHGKSKGQHFDRNRMEWKDHIEELTEEGSDAFQQMFRMEYSVFLKL